LKNERNAWLAVSVLLAAPVLTFGQPGTITTVAGNGSSGSTGDGWPATSASIVGNGDGVAVDSKGNLLIAEPTRLRRVDSTTGIITTIAGGGSMFGDGIPATSAFLNLTDGAASDAAGNIYISAGSTIRKIDTSGIITTVAGNIFNLGYSGDGGPATSAGMQARDLALDSAGNMYISDTLDNRIRKVNTAGIISTIAGTGAMGFGGDGGPATSAILSSPQGVSVDSAGNVYFADLLNQRVRKVDTSGNISTVASGSIGPEWTAVDAAGNLYICDSGDNEVLKLDTSNKLTTYAGTESPVFGGDGGPAVNASLALPGSIALDSSGNLYILDTDHYRVRKVQGSGGSTGATPAITGVTNGASFVSGVTSNAWASIYGTNLSAVTDTWNNSIVNGALPTTLDGVSVTVGFAPAYIAYVSPTLINLIVPPSLSGSVPVVVKNANGSSASFTANATTYGPAFFLWPNNQPVATFQNYSIAAKNGTFSAATTPAAPGSVLILWGTGFGPTIPAVPPGVETPTLGL
jgi:uncharacterized protein (TIGR03437 family)